MVIEPIIFEMPLAEDYDRLFILESVESLHSRTDHRSCREGIVHEKHIRSADIIEIPNDRGLWIRECFLILPAAESMNHLEMRRKELYGFITPSQGLGAG